MIIVGLIVPPVHVTGYSVLPIGVNVTNLPLRLRVAVSLISKRVTVISVTTGLLKVLTLLQKDAVGIVVPLMVSVPSITNAVPSKLSLVNQLELFDLVPVLTVDPIG